MMFPCYTPIAIAIMVCIICHCSLPKLRTRTPIRPLVDINKELKLKHSTHISIVTYNLLAQDLIDKNMHLYNERDPEHLKWDFRKENLLKELIESGADVRCNFFLFA